MKLIVNGAAQMSDVPGLDTVAGLIDIVFAPGTAELEQHLPGSDIFLGWNFRGRDLRYYWEKADRLKWIHWCGAGVDAVLFPELVASKTVLTNARGIFDEAMAEYVLGYMLIETKGFQKTWALQQQRQWDMRLTEKLAGAGAVIFGVGSIGREIGRLLKANGIKVAGVGRSGRDGDPVFGEIYPASAAHQVIADADWVIAVMPLTQETTGFCDAAFFKAMKPSARFINIGRGKSVDEQALKTALVEGQIAGAMLDVFHNEPLSANDALWDIANLTISPHMSGDYVESPADMAAQFLENLRRFLDGKELMNIVSKELGFVHTGADTNVR